MGASTTRTGDEGRTAGRAAAGGGEDAATDFGDGTSSFRQRKRGTADNAG